MSAGSVILIDDEEDVRRSFEQTLLLKDFSVQSFARADRALERVGRGFDGVILSDIRMPVMDGLAFLEAVQDVDPEIPVVLITGHGDVPLAVKAMRAGAYDFLEKPLPPSRVVDAARRACALRRLTLENRALRSELGDEEARSCGLIGQSAPIIALRRKIAAVAPSDVDVLILGETGAGKDLVARCLHEQSERCENPFVAINLAALPTATIESELFGHEAGAFPGAHRAKVGKFEHARGGTLFLDEIGAAPLDVQIKLLRVLEDRTIVRLGSNERIELNARFLASSNRDLAQMAEIGAFRKDLLYRLAVVTLCAPPMRERLEDAPRLFYHLVRQAANRLRREPPDVEARVLSELSSYDWPGNVREMRNAAERYVLGLGWSDTPSEVSHAPLSEQLEHFERGAIAASLARHQGNLKATYESLGMSRKTLYEKMQKHGLRREDYEALGDEKP